MSVTLDSKLMETKLKYGWTTEKFAEYLKMSTDEFSDHLEKTFSSNKRYLNYLKSRLEQNGKAFQKGKKQSKNRTPQKATSSPVFQEEAKKEAVMLKAPKEVKAQVTLEELLLEEEKLSKSICNDEASHKKLIEQKHSLLSSLEKEKLQMEKIKTMIETHEQNIKDIISNLNNLKDNICVSNHNLAEKRADLDTIHGQILSLKKVTIFVYDNGEFELDNYEKEISDVNSAELFSKLINEDFAENLTLKQLKQLAKLKCLVGSLEGEQSYEIVFDSTKLEEAFYKIA